MFLRLLPLVTFTFLKIRVVGEAFGLFLVDRVFDQFLVQILEQCRLLGFEVGRLLLLQSGQRFPEAFL